MCNEALVWRQFWFDPLSKRFSRAPKGECVRKAHGTLMGKDRMRRLKVWTGDDDTIRKRADV